MGELERRGERESRALDEEDSDALKVAVGGGDPDEHGEAAPVQDAMLLALRVNDSVTFSEMLPVAVLLRDSARERVALGLLDRVAALAEGVAGAVDDSMLEVDARSEGLAFAVPVTPVTVCVESPDVHADGDFAAGLAVSAAALLEGSSEPVLEVHCEGLPDAHGATLTASDAVGDSDGD